MPSTARGSPIATYDPERTRRVGELGVVPTGGAARLRARGARAWLRRLPHLRRRTRSHCFTIDEIRAGQAFAFVEEPDGARLIGLVTDGPDAGRAQPPAARSLPPRSRRTPSTTSSSACGRPDQRDARARTPDGQGGGDQLHRSPRAARSSRPSACAARLRVEVEATETERGARDHDRELDLDHVQRARQGDRRAARAPSRSSWPRGIGFPRNHTGVIVTLGQDRMR